MEWINLLQTHGTGLGGMGIGSLIVWFSKNCRKRDNADAAKIGYQHVYTIDKMKDVGHCMETLKLINTEIYAQTYRLCGGNLTFKPK